MADLFEGLPPPSAPVNRPPSSSPAKPPPAPLPSPPLKSALKRKQLSFGPSQQPSPSDSTDQVPALKSALKRAKPSVSVSPSDSTPPESNEEAQAKKLRFRETRDATETQIKEAMQKISTHIKNPSKFAKASKLASQLIQSGSVKKETSDEFFAILEASMGSLSTCNEPALRADYHALFTASHDVSEHFDKKQKNRFAEWTLHAVVANDLHTDDSFVFSKAVTKIKDAISNLPPATPDEDKDEAESLEAPVNAMNEENNASSASDPFGLDDLFPEKSTRKAEEDEPKRFLRSQREVLLKCLEIAANRYRLPWTQTTIDILAKHAVEHVERFTRKQREAIEKLWASIKEQQIRRKQGKSVTGKLDVNGFEWLQEKYSNEKISIRRGLGGGGRKCETWLG